MAKKKGNKIGGQFVALSHNLLLSKAYMSLSSSEKVMLNYFLIDRKHFDQTQVILTFEQAKKYKVCHSPSTFLKSKKGLVNKGFIDPKEPGGLGKCSTFSISDRWKRYGTNEFNKVLFKPGVGSKYFKNIWNDDTKRKNLLEARNRKQT